MNIGAIGYGIAFAAFAVLTLLLTLSRRRQPVSSRLIVASAFTTIWAGVAMLVSRMEIPFLLLQVSELGRDLFWALFLIQILELRVVEDAEVRARLKRWRSLLMGAAVAVLVILVLPGLIPEATLPPTFQISFPLVVWIAFAVLGLLLVEQLYRNANREERWAIKYLCLGLGMTFAFDFFLYSEALLFKKLNPNLWQARGYVDSLAVPLIAIAAARNQSWSSRIHVSRHVVFHSVTLLAAGIYLLIMASAGFFIRYYGGRWGSVLQITFLVGTGLVLAVLLFSDSIRARIRVFLAKHFFSYKYDYREEWARFTRTLASGNEPIPQRAIRAIATLVDSRGGMVWWQSGEHGYELTGNWNMDPPSDLGRISAEDPLVRFMADTGWVVEVDEYLESPSLYDSLDLPSWVNRLTDAWLFVPLEFRDELMGILVLRHSISGRHLNWEDRDLLKMAGKQAATHLAQHQADQALMQARQFEAFNRLSAYIVHDLKNILAQQSLIVSNAEKHKNNPAFVDDVIATIENSVQRMTRLMEQMRSGMRGQAPKPLALADLLQRVVARRAHFLPRPHLEIEAPDIVVEADEERLATVFGHIIQNAQEATPDDGTVTVRLFRQGLQAIIEIRDTGVGMDAAFISERLFKPFDSTKGLTGMGIGVFESREYIRSLGGEIQVESTPGKGSLFRILMPCTSRENDQDPDQQGVTDEQ